MSATTVSFDSLHRRRAALALAALLILILFPTAARAGTYKIYNCQDPAGALASTSAWSFEQSTPEVASHDDTCPRGGVHVRLKASVAHPPDAYAKTFIWAPADTTIVSYTLWRSARVAAGTPYFFSAMERYGTDWRWAGAGCKGTTNNCSKVGDPSQPLTDANKFSRKPATPITGIALYVSCGNANSGTTNCPSSSGVAAETWLHRADITMADDVKPNFETTPTGQLVDGTSTVSGIAPVSVQASDKGGGLTQAQVEVDGTVVATQPLRGTSACSQPYTTRVPCPLRASATVPVDTSKLSDGTHSVRVLVQDVGGNTTAWGPVPLTTHNDQSCNPDPAVSSDAAKLTAGLVRPGRRASRRGRRSLTVRYSSRKRARLTGRLVGASGNAIGGAPVCIVWRPRGLSAQVQTLARLTTDADGRFATAIPRGPSRDLFVIYRTPAGAVTSKTVLRVIPKLTVRPSDRSLANGDVLTLRGRIGGGPIPARGVIVRAEAFRGTHWQPFGEARAKGSSGRYRIRYRFVGTTGTQRYTLRIRVLSQAGYPYQGVKSRRVHVRVRG